MAQPGRRFRCVVIDDEWLVRAELKQMLSHFPSIEVVGEAGSVDEAVEVISETRPDVLFLDIQMPGKSGFDLLEQIRVSCDVIFVTAYDQYALRAFEVNALDYLLKPVTPERLAKAIDRLTTRSKPAPRVRNRLNYDDAIYVVVDGAFRFVKISKIKYITAAGNYSFLVYGNRRPELVPKTLREWEEILPDGYFARVHRSTIVNFEYVTEIKKGKNYNFHLYLEGVDKPLTMSRRYAARLKKSMAW